MSEENLNLKNPNTCDDKKGKYAESRPFRLFDLPALPMINAIRDIDQITILHCTMKYQVVYKNQALRYRAKSLTWIYTDQSFGVIIVLADQGTVKIKLGNVDISKAEGIKINLIGMQMEVTGVPLNTNWIVQPDNEMDRFDFMDALTTHLMRLYKIEKYNLQFSLKSHKIGDLSIWTRKKTFGPVSFFFPTDTLKMNPDEFSFLMNDVKDNNLLLDELTFENFQHHEFIHQAIVKLDSVNRAETNSFFEQNFTSIWYTGETDPNVNCFDIIKHWIGGGYDNLKTIACVNPNNSHNVLDKLDTMPTIFANRDITTMAIGNPENALVVDILRKTDNRRATIALTPFKLSFFVWYSLDILHATSSRQKLMEVYPEVFQYYRNKFSSKNA